jgi:hypothetical protein
MPVYCPTCPEQPGTQVQFAGCSCIECSVAGRGERDPDGRIAARAAERSAKIKVARAQHDREILALSGQLPPTKERIAAAIAGALSVYETALGEVQEKYHGRILMATIVILSCNNLHGQTLEMECRDGSFKGGSRDGGLRPNKVIMVNDEGTEWRHLNAKERTHLFRLNKFTCVFTDPNKVLAERVEHALHLVAQERERDDSDFMLLQSVAGNGGVKAGPPYEVGVNFIPFNEDGTLPLAGARLWPPPRGARPKPPAKKRAKKTTAKKTTLLTGQQALTEFFAVTKATAPLKNTTNSPQKKKSKRSEESDVSESEESYDDEDDDDNNDDNDTKPLVFEIIDDYEVDTKPSAMMMDIKPRAIVTKHPLKCRIFQDDDDDNDTKSPVIKKVAKDPYKRRIIQDDEDDEDDDDNTYDHDTL